MNANFNIIEESNDGVIFLKVSGELDALAAPTFKDKLTELLDNNQTKIIIDFEELALINSLAIGILRGKLRKVKATKGNILLCNLNNHIKSIFEMVGLDEVFDIYDSKEQALTHF